LAQNLIRKLRSAETFGLLIEVVSYILHNILIGKLKMEKKVFLLLITLIGAYSVDTYPSFADQGAWVWQFDNAAGGSNVGLITYGLTNDLRCQAACKKGQYCRINGKGVAICKPYCGDGIVAVG